MNPMWTEMGKNADMFKKTCVNCERNLEDLIDEAWCTKHDSDKLPLFGCGYWRVRPDLGAEFAKRPKYRLTGQRWRITECR